MSKADYLVVFISFPTLAEAKSVGRALVDDGVAACVHVVSGITAIYSWEGKVEEAPQTLLVVKTTGAAWPTLVARVQAQHSDEVPEIIALPIVKGLPSYLEWIDSAVSTA